MSEVNRIKGLVFIPAAFLSFVTMMAGMIALVPMVRLATGRLRVESIGEHLAAAMIATPAPTMLVIVAVFLPVVYAVMRWARNPSPRVLAVGGALAAPLAALLLLGMGTALWGPMRHAPPPSEVAAFLFIYAAGGFVFGLTVGKLRQG